MIKIKMKPLISVSLIILFLFSTFFLSSCTPYQPSDLNAFAQCLTDQGAVMYGASWCSHCQEQKELFGQAFNKINYVECTLGEQKCVQEEIQYFPTWKFADSSSQVGKLTFAELMEKTGCR